MLSIYLIMLSWGSIWVGGFLTFIMVNNHQDQQKAAVRLTVTGGIILLVSLCLLLFEDVTLIGLAAIVATNLLLAALFILGMWYIPSLIKKLKT